MDRKCNKVSIYNKYYFVNEYFTNCDFKTKITVDKKFSFPISKSEKRSILYNIRSVRRTFIKRNFKTKITVDKKFSFPIDKFKKMNTLYSVISVKKSFIEGSLFKFYVKVVKNGRDSSVIQR